MRAAGVRAVGVRAGAALLCTASLAVVAGCGSDSGDESAGTPTPTSTSTTAGSTTSATPTTPATTAASTAVDESTLTPVATYSGIAETAAGQAGKVERLVKLEGSNRPYRITITCLDGTSVGTEPEPDRPDNVPFVLACGASEVTVTPAVDAKGVRTLRVDGPAGIGVTVVVYDKAGGK